VNTGVEQELLADGKEHLIGRLNVGGGLAYSSPVLGTSYLMLDADLIAGGALQDNFSLGIGPSAGILKKLTSSWKLNLLVQAVFYDLGAEHDNYKASLAQSITLNTNNTIDLTLSREKTFRQYQSEARVMWNRYF
jgi:alpha-D-ribose 1-methylphosphonate 5-triphosphate diphosphatase PhnM